MKNYEIFGDEIGSFDESKKFMILFCDDCKVLTRHVFEEEYNESGEEIWTCKPCDCNRKGES